MLFSPPFFLLILSFFSRFSSYVPATAELKYLYMARRLELYGIHPQEVTVSTDLSLSLPFDLADFYCDFATP